MRLANVSLHFVATLHTVNEHTLSSLGLLGSGVGGDKANSDSASEKGPCRNGGDRLLCSYKTVSIELTRVLMFTRRIGAYKAFVS